MEVRVDETRRHDVAGRLHRLGPRDCIFGDCNNATVLDADIGNVVKQGFGVDDPAVVDHQIIVLRECR